MKLILYLIMFLIGTMLIVCVTLSRFSFTTMLNDNAVIHNEFEDQTKKDNPFDFFIELSKVKTPTIFCLVAITALAYFLFTSIMKSDGDILNTETLTEEFMYIGDIYFIILTFESIFILIVLPLLKRIFKNQSDYKSNAQNESDCFVYTLCTLMLFPFFIIFIGVFVLG